MGEHIRYKMYLDEMYVNEAQSQTNNIRTRIAS